MKSPKIRRLFLFRFIVAIFGPKAQPFSQPWASPRGTWERYWQSSAQRANRSLPPYRGMVGPLGRKRDIASTLSRALPWAGRTAPLRGRVSCNRWEQKSDTIIPLPVPSYFRPTRSVPATIQLVSAFSNFQFHALPSIFAVNSLDTALRASPSIHDDGCGRRCPDQELAIF
jgi:hypothetical protein